MNNQPQLYIFAGGGSGGHLYPGLAVAHELVALNSNHQVLFLTTDRTIDEDILAYHPYEHLPQPIRPLPNRPAKIIPFLRGWRQTARLCHDLFRQRQPVAILGLGGYAAGAAMKIGAKRNIPVAMLNPDALPGKANAYGAKYCDKIFLQWAATAEHFKNPDKCIASGCPIRNDLFAISRAEALQEFGLQPDLKTLVIMGGSLGGHNVNRAVLETFQHIQQQNATSGWQFLHLTGKEDHAPTETAYRKLNLTAQVLPFTNKMAALLATADLTIARAGASTLAELTAQGLPSILLPYPYHKDQHQNHNAHNLEIAGAARIVTDFCDPQKTSQQLTPLLLECMTDSNRRKTMATAAQKLGQPNAAQEIAKELDLLARNG